MIGDELNDHFSLRNEITVNDNSNVIFSNQILIINLAAADFLMGVYLCCLSVYVKLCCFFCSVYGKDLTIMEVSETGYFAE